MPIKKNPCKIVLATLSLLLIPSMLSHAQTKGVSPNKKSPEPMIIDLASPLNDPVAIDVDDYGRIYVYDGGRKQVMLFDSNGEMDASWAEEGYHIRTYPEFGRRKTMNVLEDGRVLLGSTGFLPNRVLHGPGPDDISTLPFLEENQRDDETVAPDGTTYQIHWPEKEKGETDYVVSGYKLDGTRIARWSVPESRVVVYGRDGFVYVGLNYQPKILVFDKTGKKQREIDLSQLYKTEGSHGGNFAVDTNGDIYQGLYHLDPSGKMLFSWHIWPDLPGVSMYPTYRSVLRNGLLYELILRDEQIVPRSDGNGYTSKSIGRGTAEIQVYTPDGTCVARYLPKSLPIELPTALAVKADGTCAVTRFAKNSLALVLNSNGKIVQPTGPLVDYMSFALAVPDGGFWEGGGSVLVSADNSGKWLKNIEHPDNQKDHDTSKMFSPHHMAIDPLTGDIWALGGAGDGTGGIFMIYDKDGNRKKQFPPNDKLDLYTNVGMAFDSKGLIYLPDAWCHRIAKVDREGNVIEYFSHEGNGFGELKYPEQLAMDKQDRLYVADTGNSRISVFSTDGTPLGYWGTKGKGDGQLDRPYGVAIGPHDTIWISDTFNDRIVKVPMEKFWKEIHKETVQVKKADPIVKQAVPIPGQVTINGFVTAGTDDFTDSIYVESPDQAWGTRVTVKDGVVALRGETCKITGIFEIKERAAKHLIASKVQQIKMKADEPAPLEMANLYVGDGYQKSDTPVSISNLGLLVRTWGRVLSVSPETNRFIINDGSYLDDSGLIVDARSLKRPIENWPIVGDYVCVTGISVNIVGKDKSNSPGIRIRDENDIEVLEEE